MAAQTELILSTSVKGTEQATKALNDVKGSLDGISKSAESASGTTKTLSQRLKDNQAGFIALGAAAGAATYAITSGIRGSIKEATNFQNSMVGLQSVVEGTGNDFEKAKEFINDYTKDGLITAGEAATTLKLLLQRGFGLEEANKLMVIFKDNAAFGRAAHLSLGEAIVSTAEGLKNENSMLTDNGGMTKNLSLIWGDYAKSLGVGVNSLTLAQKRQAELNGWMEEGKYTVGDATKYADGYAGAVARQNAASQKLQQTIGSSLMPSMTALTEAITSLLIPISNWITEHPKLSSYLIIGTTAVLGLTTAVAALSAAIPLVTSAVSALGVVLGVIFSPIGLITAAILGLGTAVYTVWKNWDAIRPSLIAVWEQIKNDVSAVIQSMKEWIFGAFDEIIRKVDEAINYLAEKARQAKNFVNSILNAYSESSVGKVLGAPGAALGDFIYGARASGGPVIGGKPYLVGEKGPEIFTPGTSGQIIPNNKIGGGSSIVINISGMFGSDAVGELSDAIVMNLKRASYI